MAALTKAPEIMSQSVGVYINEQHVADWNVTTIAPFNCDVPRELSRAGGILTVELTIPGAVTPESLKINLDPRPVGVCCKTAVLSQKNHINTQPSQPPRLPAGS